MVVPSTMGTMWTQTLVAFLACAVNLGNPSDICVQLSDNRTMLIVGEDKNVTVMFTLSDQCRTMLKHIAVRVASGSRDNFNVSRSPICYFIKLTEGANCSRERSCWCEGNTSPLFVISRHPTSEFEQWQIQPETESGTLNLSASLSVYKQYYPNITEFSIYDNTTSVKNSPVDVSDSVTVTCSWTKRLLASNASLYKDGVQIPSWQITYLDSRVNYVIERINCSHSGKYTCAVPWSRNNETLLLQVRCAPEFLAPSLEFTIEPSGLLNLQFAVRVYSRSMIECTLWRYGERREEGLALQRLMADDVLVGGCARSDLVPGQETNLTFLPNVTSEAAGLWELRLTDGFGRTTTQLFCIRGAEGHQGDKSGAVSLQVMVLVAAAISVVVLIIIVVIVAAVFHHRNKIKHVHLKGEKKLSRDALYRGSNVSISITNNIYDSTTNVRAMTPGLATDPDLRGHGVQEKCAESASLGEYCTVADNVSISSGPKPLPLHYEDISDVRGIIRQPLLPSLLPKSHVTVDSAKDVQHTSNQYVSIQDIKDRKRQITAKKKPPTDAARN